MALSPPAALYNYSFTYVHIRILVTAAAAELMSSSDVSVVLWETRTPSEAFLLFKSIGSLSSKSHVDVHKMSQHRAANNQIHSVALSKLFVDYRIITSVFSFLLYCVVFIK